MENYKNLKVWQIGHELTLDIYRITAEYPQSELWALVSQMRRSSSSIPTNIAEGSGRTTDRDFLNFLHMSLGSANEIEYQVLLSYDLNYIPYETKLMLDRKIGIVKRLLLALIKKIDTDQKNRKAKVKDK